MLWIFAIIWFVSIPVQSDDADEYFSDAKPNSKSREQSFVEVNNAFGLHLYKLLSSSDGNIFFCPACLSASLAMLMEASASDTASEFKKLLPFKRKKLNASQVQDLYTAFSERMKTEKCLAQFSNTLFAQENFGLKQEFAEKAETVYSTEIFETDFYGNPQQAVWDVNESIKVKTQGRIKRLFERLDGKNSMLLVNALYFKMNFAKIFDSDVALKGSFYNHGFQDHEIEIFVMEKKDTVQKIANSYDFRALELPCGEERNSAIKIWIFLPHRTETLPDVEYGLSTATFKEIKASLKYVAVNITIPRIRFDFSKDVSKDLRKLGLQKAFDVDADFSSMTDNKGLYLSEVLQRSIVDINGYGSHSYESNDFDSSLMNQTEVLNVSAHIPPFTANHPFMFCVIDSETGLILYLGRVYEF